MNYMKLVYLEQNKNIFFYNKFILYNRFLKNFYIKNFLHMRKMLKLNEFNFYYLRTYLYNTSTKFWFDFNSIFDHDILPITYADSEASLNFGYTSQSFLSTQMTAFFDLTDEFDFDIFNIIDFMLILFGTEIIQKNYLKREFDRYFVYNFYKDRIYVRDLMVDSQEETLQDRNPYKFFRQSVHFFNMFNKFQNIINKYYLFMGDTQSVSYPFIGLVDFYRVSFFINNLNNYFLKEKYFSLFLINSSFEEFWLKLNIYEILRNLNLINQNILPDWFKELQINNINQFIDFLIVDYLKNDLLNTRYSFQNFSFFFFKFVNLVNFWFFYDIYIYYESLKNIFKFVEIHNKFLDNIFVINLYIQYFFNLFMSIDIFFVYYYYFMIFEFYFFRIIKNINIFNNNFFNFSLSNDFFIYIYFFSYSYNFIYYFLIIYFYKFLFFYYINFFINIVNIILFQYIYICIFVFKTYLLFFFNFCILLIIEFIYLFFNDLNVINEIDPIINNLESFYNIFFFFSIFISKLFISIFKLLNICYFIYIRLIFINNLQSLVDFINNYLLFDYFIFYFVDYINVFFELNFFFLFLLNFLGFIIYYFDNFKDFGIFVLFINIFFDFLFHSFYLFILFSEFFYWLFNFNFLILLLMNICDYYFELSLIIMILSILLFIFFNH